jgi:hypothetical protein
MSAWAFEMEGAGGTGFILTWRHGYKNHAKQLFETVFAGARSCRSPDRLLARRAPGSGRQLCIAVRTTYTIDAVKTRVNYFVLYTTKHNVN